MIFLLYLFAGFLGAVLKDIVQDNKLVMPKVVDGALVLGFIGGGIVGGAVGVLVDGSFISAMLAGYAGSSVLRSLVATEITGKIKRK